MVRDSTTGANPRLWKALLNIRPGKTIAINWSAVTMLVAITAPTVEATREPADFATLMTGSISRSTSPAFSTTPPEGERRDDQPDGVQHALHAAPGNEMVDHRVAGLRLVSACQSEPHALQEQERPRNPVAGIGERNNPLRRDDDGEQAPVGAPRKIALNGGNLRIARASTTRNGTNNSRVG